MSSASWHTSNLALQQGGSKYLRNHIFVCSHKIQATFCILPWLYGNPFTNIVKHWSARTFTLYNCVYVLTYHLNYSKLFTWFMQYLKILVNTVSFHPTNLYYLRIWISRTLHCIALHCFRGDFTLNSILKHLFTKGARTASLSNCMHVLIDHLANPNCLHDLHSN